jgi:hypothetical protein
LFQLSFFNPSYFWKLKQYKLIATCGRHGGSTLSL